MGGSPWDDKTVSIPMILDEFPWPNFFGYFDHFGKMRTSTTGFIPLRLMWMMWDLGAPLDDLSLEYLTVYIYIDIFFQGFDINFTYHHQDVSTIV